MIIRPERRYLVALAVGAVVVLAATQTSVRAQSHQRTNAVSAAARARDPEYSPLQPLGGRFGLLGENQFPNVYAGVELVHGVLVVYVVPRHDAPFLTALKAADSARLPYTVVDVKASYATLVTVSSWIAARRAILRDQGLIPVISKPDPSANAVMCTLQAPTSNQIQRLQSAVRLLSRNRVGKKPAALAGAIFITKQNYLHYAAILLNAESPKQAPIILTNDLMRSMHLDYGHAADFTPFYGADEIWYTLQNIEECTSNFSFYDASNPSTNYVVTAAHCSGYNTGRNFFTCYHRTNGKCDYNVGTVTRVYTNYDDFELIPSSAAGYVWNDSNDTYWGVNGYIIVIKGDLVTTDGTVSGANYDQKVYDAGGNGFYVFFDSEAINYGVQLSSSACVQGDSGGPILQREQSGGHIYAASIILGTGVDMFGNHYCFGQQIYHIRDQAHVGLIWGI